MWSREEDCHPERLAVPRSPASPEAEPPFPRARGSFWGNLCSGCLGKPKGHPAVPAGFPSIGRLNEAQQRDTPPPHRPPPALLPVHSPAVSSRSCWSPCVPAREQNQVNKQPGEGVGTEVRAPLQRGPPPARPAGDGQVSPPRRLPQRSPPRPRTVTEGRPRAGAILGVRWLYARSLQTGKLRLRQSPGILALQSSQAQQLSPPTGNCEKLSLGQGRVEEERRRDTPAADDEAQAERSWLGGEGWSDQRSRKRKLLCLCVRLEVPLKQLESPVPRAPNGGCRGGGTVKVKLPSQNNEPPGVWSAQGARKQSLGLGRGGDPFGDLGWTRDSVSPAHFGVALQN